MLCQDPGDAVAVAFQHFQSVHNLYFFALVQGEGALHPIQFEGGGL